MTGSSASYRNWLKDGELNEPTGGEETSASWMTTTFKDEIMVGLFIGLIIGLVYLLLVISCCTMNSCFAWCGLKKNNSCCLILSASFDGIMSAIMLLFALGSIMGAAGGRGNVGR